MKGSILLAQREANYGDETVSFSPTDALLVGDLETEQYAGNQEQRTNDAHTLGNQESINTDPHSMRSFTMDAAPSGVLGTAPANGHVIEACGLDELVDPGVSVKYTPPDNILALRTGRTSLALAEYDTHTGMLQKAFGVMGSLAFEANAKKLMKWKISNARGTYSSHTGENPPVIGDAVWAAQKVAKAFIAEHIKSAQIDGFATCPQSFMFDWGMQLINLATCDKSVYGDYVPKLNAQIKAPTFAEKNFYAKLESHIDGGLVVPVELRVADPDDTAGKRITIQCAEVQLISIKRTLVENIEHIDIVGDPRSVGSVLFD